MAAAQAGGPREVPEIAEAISLFESWERSIGDYAAAQSFTEAVQLLDDYLECEPDTPHRAFIQNLRVANTRRLLRQLAHVDSRDFGVWLEYALAVAGTLSKETRSVMASHPDLKKDFDAFMNIWGDAVRQALR
jgi:hypothetical protein